MVISPRTVEFQTSVKMSKLHLIAKSIRAELRRRLLGARLSCKQDVCDAPTLIIAPHPDDETFAAGGLIALKRKAGVPVRLVLLTDGERSLQAWSELPAGEVGRVRRRQFERAIACLGVDPGQAVCCRLADGMIPRRESPGFGQAVEDLAAEIAAHRPREVYCPHPHDALPDHEAAARIALAAVQASGHRPRLIFYPVWAWFNARWPIRRQFDFRRAWRLDIRRVCAAKAAAMAEYLDHRPPGRDVPYCGRLPGSLIRAARATNEIYFDANGID